MTPAAQITCATWNVHRAIGADNRVDPSRLAAALKADIAPLRPDVLALQESDACPKPHAALVAPDDLARITGLRSVHDGPDMLWGPQSGGYLGNVMLVRPTLQMMFRRIIELPGHAPRAAVLAEFHDGQRAFRVVSCHLALLLPLRALQMRHIGQVLDRRAAMQTIVMGDLNEWRPWSGGTLSHRMTGLRLSGPLRRTFPARRPLFPLDRILTDRRGAIRYARAVDTPRLRSSSDHLPLAADVILGDEPHP